jgi:saccharopine dehydrogenase (NAD+, L-lysine-forming)
MRIAILGASGNAGRAVGRLLRAHTSYDLVLLGRDPPRLEHACLEVEIAAPPERRHHMPLSRCRTTVVSPNDPATLTPALDGCDVLVVAAPISATIGSWVQATLDAGCDWFDLTLSATAKWDALRALEPRAVTLGRCVATDGGVHPGLPGALARLAAKRIDARAVRVALRFGLAWKELELSAETIAEFADELAHYDARLLAGGRWVRGWRYARRFDFGPGIGSATCAPMYLAELADAHQVLPDVRDLGFFVAGFGAAIDYGVMPLASALTRFGRAGRSLGAALLASGLKRFGSKAGPCRVLLQADGADGETLSLTLSSDDAYVLTAAPVVAALLQWDEARTPGVTSQAMMVDPERLLDDMERLGVARA